MDIEVLDISNDKNLENFMKLDSNLLSFEDLYSNYEKEGYYVLMEKEYQNDILRQGFVDNSKANLRDI